MNLFFHKNFETNFSINYKYNQKFGLFLLYIKSFVQTLNMQFYVLLEKLSNSTLITIEEKQDLKSHYSITVFCNELKK